MHGGGDLRENGVLIVKTFYENLLLREEQVYPCNAIWIQRRQGSLTYGGICLGGLALHGDTKNGERIDVQLEEWEEKKKTKGMEYGATCINVETILDKENFALDELLDEDEIIQECKALNGRLINL
ncbi:hypothetical protein MTR67_008855 [Solanum verrucosum]|uniref:Uncharacterized protein n=1 Tax=Solanum verrucosum TaxID=315347 RepID=A0AAF0Q4M3_SOLVR|nr:hypothetical protein MTR67_008855 [Solanum verrucosum]